MKGTGSTFTGMINDIRMRNMAIPRKKWKEIALRYPALQQDKTMRILFFFFVVGKHVLDKDTNRILIPCWLLAKFAGKSQKNCNTGKILEKFQGLFPSFQWCDYYYQGQKCRQIICTGIPEMFEDIFGDPTEESIYVDDLKAQNYRNRLSRIAEAKKEALTYKYEYKDAEMIAHYHLEHTLADFMGTLEKNFSRAWEMALTHPEKDYCLRVMREIWDFPIPIYFPSRKSKTPRIFSNGAQYLPREFRPVMFPDWIETDLRSCQYAAVAMIGNIESARIFLQTDENIWKTLLSYMVIPEKHWSTVKQYVKEALYSIIFGKQGYAVQEELSNHLNDLGVPYQARLIDHPLMRDLLRTIKQLKKDMIRAGGWQGAYGWLEIEPGEDMDSFISRVVQSYELRLIAPVYRIAIADKKSGNPRFKVMLHQHDGVSLKFFPGVDVETEKARMKYAVDQEAIACGVPTTLIFS